MRSVVVVVVVDHGQDLKEREPTVEDYIPERR